MKSMIQALRPILTSAKATTVSRPQPLSEKLKSKLSDHVRIMMHELPHQYKSHPYLIDRFDSLNIEYEKDQEAQMRSVWLEKVKEQRRNIKRKLRNLVLGQRQSIELKFLSFYNVLSWAPPSHLHRQLRERLELLLELFVQPGAVIFGIVSMSVSEISNSTSPSPVLLVYLLRMRYYLLLLRSDDGLIINWFALST
jgi:hypothetical protein